MNFPHTIMRDGEPAAGGGGNPTPTPTPAPTPSPTPTPAPAPAPFYKGFYGDDGKIDKTALDRLPDHLKGFKDVFGKYETFDAMLHGFGNAHSLASKKALTPIDPNAPDHVKAERKAILDQALNVPKDPTGYGVKRPEDFPEEHWNEDGAKEMAALAHRHSLSPAAVADLLGLQVKLTRGELAKGQEVETSFFKAQDDAFAKGARESGMDVERANSLAIRGAGALGIKTDSPIFKNADVRLACMRMNALVSEDKLPPGDASGLGKVNHREQARDIMSNPQNPQYKAWNDSSDPRHEEAVEKVNQLYRLHK